MVNHVVSVIAGYERSLIVDMSLFCCSDLHSNRLTSLKLSVLSVLHSLQKVWVY